MYILISETRGVEYASKSKKKCLAEMKRLKEDDKKNGLLYEDNYYIEEYNSGFYEEGLQWVI